MRSPQGCHRLIWGDCYGLKCLDCSFPEKIKCILGCFGAFPRKLLCFFLYYHTHALGWWFYYISTFLFFNKACTSCSDILFEFWGVNAFVTSLLLAMIVSYVVPTHSCRKSGCCRCCNNPQRWLFLLFFSLVALPLLVTVSCSIFCFYYCVQLLR